MDEEELREKVKEAIESGNVDVMLSDDPEDILLDDEAGGTITLIKDVKLGDGIFGLSFADGGGFMGFILSVEDWEKMRDKVDAYIKEKGWES